MKPRELRIGNWINCYGHDRQVVGIGLDGVLATSETGQSSVRLTNPTLKPIPLTEKWLERFGFRSVADLGTWYLNFNTFDMGGIGSVAYEFALDQSDESFEFTELNRYDGIIIKHVHQLQNLYFALTGTELELK